MKKRIVFNKVLDLSRSAFNDPSSEFLATLSNETDIEAMQSVYTALDGYISDLQYRRLCVSGRIEELQLAAKQQPKRGRKCRSK